MDDLKKEVRDFWDEASCGERLLLDASDKAGYLAQMGKRYSLNIARVVLPRWLIRHLFPKLGLFMLITAEK